MKTKIIDLCGFLSVFGAMHKKLVITRFTSDNIGETLSLQVGGIMIIVPFEEIDKLIAEARTCKS